MTANCGSMMVFIIIYVSYMPLHKCILHMNRARTALLPHFSYWHYLSLDSKHREILVVFMFYSAFMYFGKFEWKYQIFLCTLYYNFKSDLIAPGAIHTYFHRSLWMLQTLIAETSKCFQSVMGTSENQQTKSSFAER